MTSQEVEEIMETGYIKPTGGDWYYMINGIFIGMGIYGAGGVVIMMILRLPEPFTWIYLLLLLAFIIYLYWRDTQLKIVKTGLPKNENLNLLRKVFNQLDWPTHELSNQIEIIDNKYILKFIRARVMYTDNFIGYNFQYISNTKAGRPAFFIGIRTYLKSKFENTLEEFVSHNDLADS
ncbi:MAG TPA: hypothetical protein VL443_29230 [Cyclobacteriaceae bacterium]|jgi:hypothetical protein|nr:hypothetical protein [Cyclobacteriaceae bacterium]